MKKLEFRWRKRTWIYIAVLVCISAVSLFLAGAFGDPMYDLSEGPIFADVNVQSIEINKTYTIAGTEFEIKSLEIGDNYTVLLFNGVQNANAMIVGADLYQNGEKIKYLSAGTSSNPYVDAAIAFEPLSSTENIELRITPIKITAEDYIFPIEYDGYNAEVLVEINGTSGIVDVELLDNECSVSIREELKDVIGIESGYPIIPGGAVLLKDGKVIHKSDYIYSKQDPPTQLLIKVKNMAVEGETIIIPIS